MSKTVLLLLLVIARAALGQYYPPISIAAQNPSGQLVYVASDLSGNLFTNGAGSTTTAPALLGYIPPMAATGQNPSGQQVYLKVDANGNLYVNCQSGCSGGGGSGNQTVTTIQPGDSPSIVAANGLFTITLDQNTSPTISGIALGQRITFQICQPASGGPFLWSWPSQIHGGMAQVTQINGLCSEQSFDSFTGTTLVAENSGATNVAP